MPAVLRLLGGGCLLLGLAGLAPAQDVRAILDRAIAAHGGAARIDQHRAAYVKSKGTIERLDGVPFQSEAWTQLPSAIREVTHIEAKGRPATIISVFNGSKGWIQANGATEEMNAVVLAHMKEMLYLTRVLKLTSLRDPAFTLSSLDAITVAGRPAAGIRVACVGHTDIKLYFDQASGLLVKTASQAVDLTTGQAVAEERIIQQYQDVDGLKTPRKMVVYRDGQKFMEAEVVEARFLDTIDPAQFAKP